ncbi:MAG: tetratricopeptide repeat protein, partial [Dolichospermum sp.]
EVTKITKLGLNEQVTALMLANLYSRYTLPQDAIQAYDLTTDTFKSYNLSADAIATLENLVKTGQQSTIVYRSLGDIYWQTGLAQKAADNYLMAIKLAKDSEDLEAQTLALFALGEVYAATDDNKQAINWYSQAMNGYTLLGDTRRANFLKRQIESLKQQ